MDQEANKFQLEFGSKCQDNDLFINLAFDVCKVGKNSVSTFLFRTN